MGSSDSLKGTRRWRPTLGGKTSRIAVYMDMDWGSHRDDRRSIGAYLISIGDWVVSWKSKKQSCVALSSTETERRRNRCGWRISWEVLVTRCRDQ